MKKRFILILLAMVFMAGSCPAAEDISALDIYGARMPIYNNGKLVMLIYSSKARRNGSDVNLDDAILDLVKRGVNVDNITYVDKVKPYALETSREVIAKFWEQITHSNGLIFSSQAIVNQKVRSARSKEKVFFRSPALDINGVGFESDFDKRTIKVLQNVIIKIRQDEKEKEGGLAPAGGKGTTTITSDELFIDFANNVICVTGNVKVDEERMHIDCDKITVYLAGKNDGEDKARPGKPADTGLAVDGGGRDISRIVCEGNVVIDRKLPAEELKLHGKQKAFADCAEYNLRQGMIILTGRRPSIMRGTDMIEGKTITIWKDSERLKAEKECKLVFILPEDKAPGGAKRDKAARTIVTSDFMDMNYPQNIAILTGNVDIRDPSLKIDCHKMTIYLEEKAKAVKKEAVKLQEKITAEKAIPSQLGDGKSISKIVCVGDVVIIRCTDEPQRPGEEQKAMAGKAVYHLNEGKIVLSENKPIIIHGKDSISGENVTVWIDRQRMRVDKQSRIALNSLREKPSDKPQLRPATTYINSDSSDINYGSNEMTFSGQVKVKDPQLTLDCSEMRVFLEDKKDKPKPEKARVDSLDMKSSDKDVSKVVCVGNVHAVDPKTTLDCDELTLLFQDKPAASRNRQSSFGSNKREISQIISKGAVKLVRKPDPAKKTAPPEPGPGQSALTQNPSGPVIVKSDYINLHIIKNYAKLIGHVDVDEPRVNLKCEDMLVLASDIKPATDKAKPAIAAEDAEFEDETAAGGPEGAIPKQILLGDKKQIDQVICERNVVIARKLLKPSTDGAQKATGEKAVYEVQQGKITMTGKNTALHQGKDVLVGTKIILWTDSEKLDIEGGKVKELILPASK